MGSGSNAEDIQPDGYPVNYAGPAPYSKSFEGTGFGVIFEDDGETGYLYATDESQDEIFDALHLYNRGSGNEIMPGDEVWIVWNRNLLKAGIYFHDQFQAIVDFNNQFACCRTGFPQAKGSWVKSSHEWNDEMVKGLG
jgi:hypothetical protein